MRRAVTVLLTVWLLAVLTAVAFADGSRAYTFRLASDDETFRTASPGDVITVTLTLHRTSGTGEMYAMQDEIVYDPEFFRLVPGSVLTRDGVQTAEITLRSGKQALYMNFLSLSGGADWDDTVLVGAFQLRVVAETGVSVVENTAAQVSTADGQESFAVTVEDLTVQVSEDCLVTFESNGGSPVPPQTVKRGALVTLPAEPVRAGYGFTGWYRDLDLTAQWHFAEDTVAGNMTLYAGWQPLPAQPDMGWFWVVLALAVLLMAERHYRKAR